MSAAETLREAVNVTAEPEKSWGMRQEPQMVSETYFLLRNKGYTVEELYLEYYYWKGKNDNKNRMEADLVFKDGTSTHVVEFKVFWNGDLNQDGTLKPPAQENIKEEYGKLRDYSSFGEVSELSLVAAFLGPDELYRQKIFHKSVLESFDGHTGFKGVRGQIINIIPC